MFDTNRSDPQRNLAYPQGASDEVDALIAALDGTQVQRLYSELQTISLAEWFVWFEDSLVEIGEYDGLVPSVRRRRLQGPEGAYASRLHHALIFVELWRVRTSARYYKFPAYGRVPDDPQTQRAMLMTIQSAYNGFHDLDLWPFDGPEGADPLPFRAPDAEL